MVESSEVFEKNYQEYRNRIATVDFESIMKTLGIFQSGEKMSLSFFNDKYFVSNDGIVDGSGNRPDYMTFVILAKYILLCPEQSCHDEEWVSFKDFKRASHFTNVNYFSSDTEKAVEKYFSGKLTDLKQACGHLNGSQYEMGTTYDLSIQFRALPRISLLLLFNDGDEDFPAKCTVLFQKHSEYYLDPESLAMTGASLARKLKQQAFLPPVFQ